MHLDFFPAFKNLRLDIVGIVAILGEGSMSRNIQASGCTWFHALPRLIPAPQALLKHHQDKRLPTKPGIVVGAYSGRIVNELNFFTQLLHDRELADFEVELVKVKREPKSEHKAHYSVKRYGHLAFLSILGCAMSITLLGLSIRYQDGAALLATLFLSFTSTFVGLASQWRLQFLGDQPNATRQGKIPHGDVVIFYPKTGSFRVVRCDEQVSRLYFNDERCKHRFNDDAYRIIALISTVLLMCGLICLGSAQIIMQAAFAVAYVSLNALYWGSSALNPAEHVWKHNYHIDRWWNNVPSGGIQAGSLGEAGTPHPDGKDNVPQTPNVTPTNKEPLWSRFIGTVRLYSGRPRRLSRVATAQAIARPGDVAMAEIHPGMKPHKHWGRRVALLKAYTGQLPPSEVDQPYRNMTSALWIAIALTGSTRWVRTANIAPDHEVWDDWLDMALKRAAPKWSGDHQKLIPAWVEIEYHHPVLYSQILLPSWDYQGVLKRLFENYHDSTKHRPIHQTFTATDAWLRPKITIYIAVELKIRLRRARNALAKQEPRPASPITSAKLWRSPTTVHFVDPENRLDQSKEATQANRSVTA